MPIYHKTPPSLVGNHNTAEIDYHTSEAAKVKRTREQAYFNSYDFDAIEVLPYDDEDEEGEGNDKGMKRGMSGGRGGGAIKDKTSQTKQSKITQPQQHRLSQRQHLPLQQHNFPQQHSQQLHLKHLPHPSIQKQQQSSNHGSFGGGSFSGGSSSSDSFIQDNHSHLHHQQQHSSNNKYNPSVYLQRFSEIFTHKTASNSNNKLQQHHHPQQQPLKERQSHALSAPTPHNPNNIVVVVGIGDADNKHLKLSSSSKTSSSSSSSSPSSTSSTLSSSSVVEEVLSGCTGCSGNGGACNVGHRDRGDCVVLDCVVNVVGTSTSSNNNNNSINNIITSSNICTTTDKNVNTKGATGNGGNFLLPRAMLKYQSTTIGVQPAVAGAAAATTASSITTANTNSMPLATAAAPAIASTTTIASNNTTATSLQQQHPTKDVNKTADGGSVGVSAKGKTALESHSAATTGALRLTKKPSTSSINTSINSEEVEDLTAIHHQGNEEQENFGKNAKPDQRKVLPKSINHPKASARASSHQSHYSTDKSASSGYYSSNVCSTYSLEEHIYSEPTMDNVKDVRNHHGKESKSKPPAPKPPLSLPATSLSSANTLQISNAIKPALISSSSVEENSVMRSLDYARRQRYAENETGISGGHNKTHLQTLPPKRKSQEFNENLKILESSIENLDRHLKSFPGTVTQDAIVAYVQNPYSSYATVTAQDKMRSSSYSHLPTIQEGLEKSKQQTWIDEKSDDSLMDIDLDSFLLDKDKTTGKHNTTLNNLSSKTTAAGGIDNPSFLTEEQEENHYKCAKYINSCPEDAYRVESDIIAPTRSSISEQSVAVSGELYPKRYEEQLHFQNTRELLEDVRDKIRLLTHTQQSLELSALNPPLDPDLSTTQDFIPKELNSMISTLKQELELYLERMNQNSELEIRQLCTGLVKNQHIVKMKNAFERRRSLTDSTNDICSTYEAVHDGIIMNAKGVPVSIRQQITSIRCSSDPNFKMKRKSLTEVFPMAECYIETLKTDKRSSLVPLTTAHQHPHSSQLQRNLNYHKPILEQISQHPDNLSANLKTNSSSSATSAGGGDTSESNDKESILDWHRKKPSIWEMYYGTNRIQQSLLGGKKNGTMVAPSSASSPSTMCYPSSRPESDFTLDLPRAEQLRIKMEKEKKFRQRCRVITTFLSLVFFLLTVMVVSLVLTRGKRMFGSMI